MRTVYTYFEFALLLSKGWADNSPALGTVVRDKDFNWHKVKLI